MKDISTEKSNVAFFKVFYTLLLIFLLYCIYWLLKNDPDVVSVFSAVILALIIVSILRFVVYNCHVTIDSTAFYYKSIVSQGRIRFSKVISIDKPFLSPIYQVSEIKITYSVSNNRKRRIWFVPNKSAFNSIDIAAELRKIVRADQPV
jgi:hypothetical protein